MAFPFWNVVRLLDQDIWPLLMTRVDDSYIFLDEKPFFIFLPILQVCRDLVAYTFYHIIKLWSLWLCIVESRSRGLCFASPFFFQWSSSLTGLSKPEYYRTCTTSQLNLDSEEISVCIFIGCISSEWTTRLLLIVCLQYSFSNLYISQMLIIDWSVWPTQIILKEKSIYLCVCTYNLWCIFCSLDYSFDVS